MAFAFGYVSRRTNYANPHLSAKPMAEALAARAVRSPSYATMDSSTFVMDLATVLPQMPVEVASIHSKVDARDRRLGYRHPDMLPTR